MAWLAAAVAASLALLPDDLAPVLAAVFVVLVVLVITSTSPVRAEVRGIALAGLTVRLFAVAGTHSLLLGLRGRPFFSTDEEFFDAMGLEIAQAWSSHSAFPSVPGMGYWPKIVASVYFVVGHSPLTVKVFNAFFGTLVVVMLYVLARRLYGRRTATIAALFVSLMPSIVFWSTTILRDVFTLALVLGALLATLALVARGQRPARQIAAAAVLLATLALLAGVRQVLAVPLAWILAVMIIVDRQALTRPAVMLLAVAALGVAIYSGTGSFFGGPYLSFLAGQLTEGRWDAGSVGASLGNLFLAPFAASGEQGRVLEVLFLPETVLWYILTPFIIGGLVIALLRRPKQSLVLLAYAAAVVLGVAVLQRDAWTTFRHRLFVFPVLLVFASVILGRLRLRARTGSQEGPRPISIGDGMRP